MNVYIAALIGGLPARIAVGVLAVFFMSARPCLAADEKVAQTDSKMTVRYRDPEDQRSLQNYKFELVHRAMELTRTEYGDYDNIPYLGPDTGQQRWASLMSEGKLINVAWVSPGTSVASANVVAIPIDVMRGFLGFRICLINAKAPLDLGDVVKTGTLNSLRIGQGATWDDIHIYRYNNINPILGPTVVSLFDMLGFGRFDCIAMGVNEVFTLLNEKKASYPFLAVDSKLLIYYDFPIYIYVSKAQPRLAERMLVGMTKMQQSGEIDKLFKEYYPEDFSALKLEARKLICLRSPFSKNPDQCTNIPAIPSVKAQ